jgi:hypothetical protein
MHIRFYCSGVALGQVGDIEFEVLKHYTGSSQLCDEYFHGIGASNRYLRDNTSNIIAVAFSAVSYCSKYFRMSTDHDHLSICCLISSVTQLHNSLNVQKREGKYATTFRPTALVVA